MGAEHENNQTYILLAYILLVNSAVAQQLSERPYPMLCHFLGKHHGFTATCVSAAQTQDGMLIEGGQEQFAYLDGKFRKEGIFSEQWSWLFAFCSQKG